MRDRRAGGNISRIVVALPDEEKTLCQVDRAETCDTILPHMLCPSGHAKHFLPPQMCDACSGLLDLVVADRNSQIVGMDWHPAALKAVLLYPLLHENQRMGLRVSKDYTGVTGSKAKDDTAMG